MISQESPTTHRKPFERIKALISQTLTNRKQAHLSKTTFSHLPLEIRQKIYIYVLGGHTIHLKAASEKNAILRPLSRSDTPKVLYMACKRQGIDCPVNEGGDGGYECYSYSGEEGCSGAVWGEDPEETGGLGRLGLLNLGRVSKGL
jgi:hypothetical protein